MRRFARRHQASRQPSIFLVHFSVSFGSPIRRFGLPLALEALFWGATGTIAGTTRSCRCSQDPTCGPPVTLDPAGSDCSKSDSYSRVESPALEWSPRVNSPAPVNCSRGTYEWVVARLPHIAKILAVDEHTGTADAPLADESPQQVRVGPLPEWRIIHALATGVEQFDPGPTMTLDVPQPVNTSGVT